MPPSSSPAPPLGWLGIARLGLAQTALGAIFVLSTSTLNRVMKVELALPAIVPGALIALQYAVQILRPRLGHGSDVGGRRTPMIVAGIAVLGCGGILAAGATGLMETHVALGFGLAVLAFLVIGGGVSAAGTALLVLLATRTAEERRPAAATIAWMMMIAGFIVTALVAGTLLDPFTPGRLLAVASGVALAALALTGVAVWGVEGPATTPLASPAGTGGGFGSALRGIWAEPEARRFAIFVFVSMLAYGGEEVMIEPFAGSRFGMTIGQTARLSGALHGGSLLGMVLVALACTGRRRAAPRRVGAWMVAGCLGSAVALTVLGLLGAAGGGARAAGLLPGVVFALGIANGCYAVAAVGTMMQQVSGPSRKVARGAPGSAEPGAAHEGLRMGLWGAAQAVAFGTGTFAAAALSDLVRATGSPEGWRPLAYSAVFAAQASGFLLAAALAATLVRAMAGPPMRIGRPAVAAGRGSA